MQNEMQRCWAIRFSEWVRKCIKLLLEVRAALSGQAFCCNALCGESEYNISINSDLSVSCNCQDKGEGTLGYLGEESFEDIFYGNKANAFRSALANGKLPILTCARCNELKRFRRTEDGGRTRSEAGAMRRQQSGNTEDGRRTVEDRRRRAEVRLPYRGLLLENTIGCNLDCPGCIRKEVLAGRRKMSLGLDELEDVAKLLDRLGLEKLFYFNRGEPFMSSRILDELKLIRKYNPGIRIYTSTNGTLLNSDAKREAALMMDEVEFSIDGCDQESLEKYQKNGSFERSYKNMKALAAARDAAGKDGPVIEWKYVLFRWNDHPKQIAKAIELAKEAGVDLISFWPTTSPFYGISWRYRLGQFRNLGKPSWKGREVWLRSED